MATEAKPKRRTRKRADGLARVHRGGAPMPLVEIVAGAMRSAICHRPQPQGCHWGSGVVFRELDEERMAEYLVMADAAVRVLSGLSVVSPYGEVGLDCVVVDRRRWERVCELAALAAGFREAVRSVDPNDFDPIEPAWRSERRAKQRAAASGAEPGHADLPALAHQEDEAPGERE